METLNANSQPSNFLPSCQISNNLPYEHVPTQNSDLSYLRSAESVKSWELGDSRLSIPNTKANKTTDAKTQNYTSTGTRSNNHHGDDQDKGRPFDSDGDEVVGFASLVSGGTYKLGPQQQPERIPTALPAHIAWKEYPPSGLSTETTRYERVEAARELRKVLLTSGGLILTPVLDQCYGAGKTSLVWRFLEILDAAESDTAKARDSDRKQKLKDSLYLSVRSTDEDKQKALASSANNEEFKRVYILLVGGRSTSSFFAARVIAQTMTGAILFSCTRECK